MSATKTAYKILVGGEFVDSVSGETMDVIAPATGEVIAEVPRCSADDVDRAVDAANKALPEWLPKKPKERTEVPQQHPGVAGEDAEGTIGAPAQARGRDRRERGGARAARVGQRRQAVDGVAGRDAV